MQNNYEYDYDYIIIGSGFGGSVSAHRLTEKGYKVAVIEAGKRFGDQDFPKTTWNLRKFFWAPVFRCFGIMRMTIFKHVFILSGAGVGGGSLVYANTLLVPKDQVWEDPQWRNIEDWKRSMPAYYETAKKMLGVTRNKFLGPADLLLKKAAMEQGYGDSFYNTDVGIFYGQPGMTVKDPYFNGAGPERTGCTLCGGCMVGCAHGAKNTLIKNYLYFAEKNGAKIIPEFFVTDVRPIDKNDLNGSGGYAVNLVSSTDFIFKKKILLKTKGVIFSAGVLGTLKLLLTCKEKKSLPYLSAQLGNLVRTNSESIIGVKVDDQGLSMGSGVAIGSGIHIDEHTHIEAVRYSRGSDALSTICTILPNDRPGTARILSWFFDIIKNPIKFVKTINPFGWAHSTIILLVMQTLDGSIKMKLKRSLLNPFSKKLQTEVAPGMSISPFIPLANKFASHLANKTEKGTAITSMTEIFLNIPTTAHILGGAVMGKDIHSGVINYKNNIFNYENMLVCDGSMIAANLGVNPSLTITALTEHAMSYIPKKLDE